MRSAATSSQRQTISSRNCHWSARTWTPTRSRPSKCSTRTQRRRATASPLARRLESPNGFLQPAGCVMFKSVLVTGGAGYVGSLLTPQLLDLGYKVTVYDIMYFGEDFLPKNNPNLKIVKGDIRDVRKLSNALKGVEAVINLACISNDASFELDEKLSTSINLDAFEPMVIAAKQAGAKRFISASSSSVYGVSETPDVTEEHPLVPLDRKSTRLNSSHSQISHAVFCLQKKKQYAYRADR